MFKKSDYNLSSCCQLPFKADIDRLREEFETEIKGKMQPVRSKNEKREGWLRYKFFRHPSFFPNRTHGVERLERQIYLNKILNTYLKGCTLVSGMYAVIPPQGSIGIHTDHLESDNKEKARAMNETVRLHIPLYTSSRTFMLMGQKFHYMKVGELWMLNNHHYHGVLNDDDKVHRNHLILDVIPSQELIATVQKNKPPVGFDDFKRLKFLIGLSNKKKANHLKSTLPFSTRMRLLLA